MSADLDSVRDLMGQAEDVDLPEDMEAPGADFDHDDDQGMHPDDPGAAPDDGGPDGGKDGGDGEGPDGPDPELIRRAAALPQNDHGNGQRYVLYYGDDVIWVPRVGWYAWTGKIWKKDPDQIEVRRKAQAIGGLVEREIPFLVLSDRQMAQLADERSLSDERKGLSESRGEDGKVTPEAQARIDAIDVLMRTIGDLRKKLGDVRKAHRSWARTSGNTTRINAMITESGVSLSRQLDEMDANPLDVNTEAGVLRFTVRDLDPGKGRLAEVELVPHDRGQLMSKSVASGYDPAATCPRFDAYLARIMPAVEMRDFLQRWFGYSMTALTSEQKLCFFYGAGANGKSVLVDLMARILADYAATAKIESLIGKNRRSGGDATPDLIPLVGARFVRASEPEEGERLQEAKIKELTGGEPMLARGLNADFFEFLPLFKLTISGNHKPDIRGTDDGIWRRVLLVPFDVQIPKAERDPMLVHKLFEERAGILNWMVEGLRIYLETGLREPDAVLAATQEYRDESDPVGAMLTEAAVVDGSDSFITGRELMEAFRFWQYERGEGVWGERTVSNKLKEKAGKWKHPTSGRTFVTGKSGVTGYRGIRLTDVFRDRFDRRPSGRGGPFSGSQAGGTGSGGGGEWDI